MVKTIRGLLSLQQLRELLTNHVRKAPSYLRVVTEKLDVTFYDDLIRLELKEPKEETCYYCEGLGMTGETECYVCKGQGKIKVDYDRTVAVIREYENYPHYGTLKIEVQTDGRNPEVWKSEVQKIKNFIEALAEKRCIIVPETRVHSIKKILITDIAQKKLFQDDQP